LKKRGAALKAGFRKGRRGKRVPDFEEIGGFDTKHPTFIIKPEPSHCLHFEQREFFKPDKTKLIDFR